MAFDSEDAVKRALAIDSWRNLSKDKLLRFVAMMPDMDKEVAVRIIEQFPQFKEFALHALDVLERDHQSTLDANAHSQDDFHRACQDIRDAIRGQLDKDGLTPDERRHLVECLMEVAKLESAKDTENKQFLEGLFEKVVVGVAAVAAFAVVFVGGRVLTDRRDSSQG